MAFVPEKDKIAFGRGFAVHFAFTSDRIAILILATDVIPMWKS